MGIWDIGARDDDLRQTITLHSLEFRKLGLIWFPKAQILASYDLEIPFFTTFWVLHGSVAKIFVCLHSILCFSFLFCCWQLWLISWLMVACPIMKAGESLSTVFFFSHYEAVDASHFLLTCRGGGPLPPTFQIKIRGHGTPVEPLNDIDRSS